MKRFLLSPAILGGALLALLAGLAVGAPVLSPDSPAHQDLAHRLTPPAAGHLLGRDDLGRDVLSRLLWGARVSLLVGICVVAASMALGGTIGAASGYIGGGLDVLVMSVVDVLLGFPGVLLAVALAAILGPGLPHLVLSLSVVGWVGYARLARSQALRLKAADFVASARASGAGSGRIVIRHLIPGLIAPVLVQAALGLGGVIMAEAGLSFLGVGVAPPAVSWGGMLQAGTQNLLDAPYLTVAPGCAIFAAVLGANLLGGGLGGSDAGESAAVPRRR